MIQRYDTCSQPWVTGRIRSATSVESFRNIGIIDDLPDDPDLRHHTSLQS